MSPGRDVSGKHCLGACSLRGRLSPGQVVSRGRLSPGRIVSGADCLGAYCLWGTLSLGQIFLGHIVSGHHVPPPDLTVLMPILINPMIPLISFQYLFPRYGILCFQVQSNNFKGTLSMKKNFSYLKDITFLNTKHRLNILLQPSLLIQT